MNDNGISSAGLSRGDAARWAISFGGALVLMASLIWLLRGPVIILPSVATPATRASIHLMAANEQAMMHDTIPLFLPTEHDATVPVPQREGAGNILGYDASRLFFRDAGPNLARTLPPPVTLNGKTAEQAKPADALAPDTAQPLIGFGRGESQTSPLSDRGGYIEIISATGQRILRETLPASAAPPTKKEWQPMEFAAVIDPSGLAIPLQITEGSRVEEVDGHFTRYLAETFRIGARLRPGFYRIVIGP